MTTDKSKQTVRSLSTGVRGKFVEDFLSRMDDDYFETFSPEEVANHLQLASRIDENNPVLVQFSAESAELREIVIVGYDYPSGFSILCGLLSAFGMDIRSGEIHSFSKRGGTAGRIVDVLKVAMKPGEVLDEVKQKEFEQELRNLTELLASGSAAEARARLNRFLIERIERMGELLSGLTSPVHLTFNNSVSEEWTVLETRSEDAFAFLFAISNALAMRGIYIHKVRIRSEAGEARDQFYIANRWNRKIEDARDQQRLHMAVSMIKEFTHFLPEAPDPAKALTHFDQFLDKLIAISEESYPDRAIAFLASSAGMSMLAHLLGSSDFLWDDFLQIHFADLLPVLEGISKSQLMPGPAHKDSLRRELRLLLDQNTSASLEEQKRKLNTFKDRRVFLIDATHIVYPDAPLTDFSYALTDLGEVFVEEASRICFDELRKRDGITSSASGSRRAFAVFGLGKFGGREMGYASDFELLFVYEDSEQAAFFETFSRMVVDLIEARSHGIFHVDLRLRPYGEAGTWSTSLEQFAKYYSSTGEAAPFERQALIKLRCVAGDESLGKRVEAHRDSFSYSGAPWNWADAMELRRRQIDELVKPGRINVKYSAGGLIDVEYAVQYLQLLNGKEHPRIRLPNTLDALEGLRQLQIIREGDYMTLHDGYLFLRHLIDGLRIVRGDATDLVLPDENSEEFKSLARRLGYEDRDRARNAEKLSRDIQQWMQKVHEYFVTRFDFHP